MSEIRRTGLPRTGRAARVTAAALVAAVALGIPAGATAAVTRSIQPAVVASARTGSAMEQGAGAASPDPTLVGAESGVRVVAAGVPPVPSPSVARGGLVARLGEARRSNGLLGQWVAGVLLAIVVALWVALVAVVVRAHMRFARSSGPGPGNAIGEEEPHATTAV